MYNAQVDPTLTSFVTAASEISSVTDPTYGPDHSSGLGESEVPSLTDPAHDAGSGAQAGAGSGDSAIAVADATAVGVGVGVNGGSESGKSLGALSSQDSDDAPTWDPRKSPDNDSDSATWTWDFPEKFQRSRDES